MTAQPRKDEPYPKTIMELVGYCIREFGIAAVFALFMVVQWQADQDRTRRIEAILTSNAEVLRGNSQVMERLANQWSTHDETAKEFIRNLRTDIEQIKISTSKIQ